MQITIMSKPFMKHKEELEKEFPSCKFVCGEENVGESQVVFGGINTKNYGLYKNMKWLQTTSSGVDGYMNSGFPKDVLLTSATGGYNLAISEYMLATTLSLFQKLNIYRDQQNKKLWQGAGRASFIQSSTVVIVGLGNIGGAYAKLVKSLGGYVIGVKRTISEKPEFVDELYTVDQLDKVLPRGDVVAIATPYTDKTDKMFNKDNLELMKDGAVILNVGRGSVIDTGDLVAALESQKLGGAILDVTDPEPLPVDNPLWSMENVIITPHTSGGYGGGETNVAILEIFKDNLKRYISGEQLVNLVDFTNGYASR